MKSIAKIDKSFIKKHMFEVEPHTVKFEDEGNYWGFFLNGELVSLLCERIKYGKRYISCCFTVKEFRKMGFMSELVNYVINLYPTETFTAHCLKANRNVFLNIGFEEKKIKHFKYGTQYFMELKRNGGKNGKTKEGN